MVLLIQKNGDGKGCFSHTTWNFSKLVLHIPKDKENAYDG